jgi:2-amino-4-hydroxy-6-hydroxymethyldihydropteridine diphosphokinase
MSLIISLGTNLGDKEANLKKARKLLQRDYTFIAQSKIQRTLPLDYLDQPDFLNQVLELEIPFQNPDAIMETFLLIEKEMGRERLIPKGPRIIDLDILFLGIERFRSEMVEIPHPRIFQRDFILVLLRELPFYSTLKKVFPFPIVQS